jgi:hypothetical protein
MVNSDEATPKNCLRERLVEWIGGASVRKTILPLTIICGCALAVSANAARTESLSFTPQTVFQKRAEKAVSEPSKSEVASKDRTGKTVSAPIVEQSQKKAVSEPSKSGVVSKDRTGKTVSAPIVEQSQKKALPDPSKSEFVFKDRTGKTVSAPIVEHYQKDRIVHPMAKIDPRLDPKLSRAATIADERAHAHSKSRCWRYVKEALVASGAVSSYPKTSLAKEAGDELVRDYGFKKLPIRDPYSAPIGSVLVYFKGRNRPGHVEIRTKTGFVSDYRSKDACRSALVGIYAKK